MVLLDSSDPAIIAALDQATGRLAVIVLNEGPARELRLNCAVTGASSSPVSWWLTEPRGKTRYQPQASLALKDGRLTCLLPADSVQTFELSLSTAFKK
jgi:hypothetical protein